ncbi:hypothetical protein Gasu2_19620 [Galdieria sulphuraria]|nr:hypothetical protein Gasu2_19620 [Galdieria sulphuraria]
MALSFLVFPASCKSFVGAQLKKAVRVGRFLGNGNGPRFPAYLRPHVQCSIFSLNLSFPKLFLFSFDFPAIGGPTVTRELGGKKLKMTLVEANAGKDANVVVSSCEKTFIIEKSALIAEWLQDTEKILLTEGERNLVLERHREGVLHNGTDWCLESSTRQEESSVPIKWSSVLIVSFGKGNRLLLGFLHVVATVVVFFVSNVFQLSKIAYTFVCRVGDGIYSVSLKLSSHGNSTNFES